MSSPFTVKVESSRGVRIFWVASYGRGKKKKKNPLPFHKRTEHLPSLVERMNVQMAGTKEISNL